MTDTTTTDPTTEPTTEPTFVTSEWTYLGQRLNRDKKLSHLWLPAVMETGCPQQIQTEGLWFLAKAHDSYDVGGIYNVKHICKGDGSYTMYSPIWTGKKAMTTEVRAIWQAEDYAAKDTDKINKAHKKARSSHDDLLEGLEPIRIAYQATNAHGKRALIAQVLEALGRRRPLVK